MTPPPRICFVATDLAGRRGSGALGTHTLWMSLVLARRGWHVHVLFCEADDEEPAAALTARLAAEGVTVTTLDTLPAPEWTGDAASSDRWLSLALGRRAVDALEVLHARHHFDLVEFPDSEGLGMCAVQAKRSGLALTDVPLAVKLYAATDLRRRGGLAGRRSAWELKTEYCERYTFAHADVRFAASDSITRIASRSGWELGDDVTVAYPLPDATDEPEGGSAAIEEVVFFGRLSRRNGLDMFLDAMQTLPHDIPVRFLGRDAVLAGRDASDVIAERFVDRPHVIETGLDRESALALLRAGGRLSVVASYTDTFGFRVGECVMNRVPFLAADVGGVREIVRHAAARDRWLFEPTAPSLAAMLTRRLATPADEEHELRLRTAEACDAQGHNDAVEQRYRAALHRPAGRLTTTAERRRTVTVAVAHRNHGAYLPGALASLAAQTRAPDQVVVIDDGSTDDSSRQIFDEQDALYPEWLFLRQENAGPGAARNRCLQHATGEYFLPFDADNIATAHLVEDLLGAVAADTGRDVATCHSLAFARDEDIALGKFTHHHAPTGGPRILTVAENVFGDTCALFRTEALRGVGGFETDPTTHEDWETLTRMAFAGLRIDVVPRVLFYYRTGAGGRNVSLDHDPYKAHAFRCRLLDLVAEAPLASAEQVALWECLLDLAQPNEDASYLQHELRELSQWAHETLAAAETWRVSQLEEVRADLTTRLDEATRHVDDETAGLRVRQLWRMTLARTVRAIPLATRTALRKRLGGR